MAITCAKCGARQSIFAALNTDLGSGKYVCPDCIEAEARRVSEQQMAEARKQAERRPIIQAAAAKVILTTTQHVDGYRVLRYLGIESVEFVIGTGVFSEVSSSIADFFGVRSSAFERKLQQAKQHAMGTLKFLAAEKGANAVIGVDLDYTEFNGNRIGLIINGTLVEIAPYG